MIKIAERLKAQAGAQVQAGVDQVSNMEQDDPAISKLRDDNKVAAYPAKNLILDSGRYYAADNKK